MSAPTAQLERAHNFLELGSPAASSINTRTLAAWPAVQSHAAASRLADASSAPAAFCCSSLHLLGFSEPTTAAAGWPWQAAGRTADQHPSREPPGAQQGAKAQAASTSVLSSQQHASVLFVSILSQSKQLQIFFILSEFQLILI